MLPKIHLGTLITVTDTHLANQSRERRQAIMEARISRNTEGFYVYQTYLKRLRRMHRAYVTRFKQQNRTTTFGSSTNPSSPLFDVRGNYIQTRQFQDNIIVNENNSYGFPIAKHRISLSGHVAAPNTPAESTSGSLYSPSVSSQFSTDGDGGLKRTVTFSKETDTMNPRPSFSIHIPCGREGSFDTSSYNQKQDNGDALPFRMWKQRRDQSGLTSVYSQHSTSVSEEPGRKSRVVVLDRPVPRNDVMSKATVLNHKK